jgi:zinc transport system permease protein
MMILSSVLGMLFTLFGLWLSYHFDFTSGATIIMVAGAAFFAVHAVEMLSGRRRSA